MGNPRNEKQSTIKKEQLIQLLRCGLNRQQICDFYGVSPFTLNSYCKRNFDGKTFEQVKAENMTALQAKVMTNLLNLSARNASAAIFLAKSICGMSDQPMTPVDNEAGEAFVTAIKTASRSIGNLASLATVPDVGDMTEDGAEQ